MSLNVLETRLVSFYPEYGVEGSECELTWRIMVIFVDRNSRDLDIEGNERLFRFARMVGKPGDRWTNDLLLRVERS